MCTCISFHDVFKDIFARVGNWAISVCLLFADLGFDTICAEPLDGLLTTREALPMRRRGLNRKAKAPCIFLR